ncbi:hypothetical protein [Desulfobacterium sp. N47]|uniref:hypothetical protein n=1 Tax=Desulfobacterium sp. N47 TaxID=3115210 RepID=UPI003F4A0AC2
MLHRLSYSGTELEPVFPDRTIGFHYWKHHKSYADKFSKLIAQERNMTINHQKKSLP